MSDYPQGRDVDSSDSHPKYAIGEAVRFDGKMYVVKSFCFVDEDHELVYWLHGKREPVVADALSPVNSRDRVGADSVWLLGGGAR